MLLKYMGPVLKDIDNAAATDWPPASLKKFDQMTFSQFLRAQGASADAIAVLKLNYLTLIGDSMIYQP
jgi:hypothetical protein